MSADTAPFSGHFWKSSTSEYRPIDTIELAGLFDSHPTIPGASWSMTPRS
jgi:hypothetical protein